MKNQRSQHLHHHKLKWLVLILVSLILIVVGYVHQRISSASKEMMTSQAAVLPQQLKEKKPFSVLVMGTDVGALGRGTSYAGNTDTMELITVNPQQQRTTMIAIPRDTLVRVDTKKGPDYVKINAAYAIGGAEQAKKQVAELLDVPVDYYVLTNMGTLQKIVNAVGGVDVDNPFAFTYEGHHFKKGQQHLNGRDALKYSRMRYDDPNNDYGRQKRGQQVIESAISSFKDHGSVSAANEIMLAIQEGVRTDLPVNKITALYLNYHPAMNKTVKDHLQGKDAIIEQTSFQIAPPREINRVSKLARRSLDLAPKGKISNYETAMYNEQTTWNGYNHLKFTLPNGAKYNCPGSGN
jgi:LCP family protein required for cell wall assembly